MRACVAFVNCQAAVPLMPDQHFVHLCSLLAGVSMLLVIDMVTRRSRCYVACGCDPCPGAMQVPLRAYSAGICHPCDHAARLHVCSIWLNDMQSNSCQLPL